MEGPVAWVFLLAAGAFEIAWAVAMKQSFGFTRLGPSLFMVAANLISVGLLSLSMKTLPLGTAYVIWTGIGAVGTFAIGIVFLGEHANAARLLAAFLIVAGLMLMKAATD
jgi:quaternary ammonium compound-resistance protein SugE